jgi:hypothetical protein
MTAHRLSLILGVVLSLSCDTPEGGPATATADESAKSWMFSVHSAEVTLSNGQLSLTGVAPQVIAFTDRPHREFDTTTMEGLVDNWAEGSDAFADDPPNAIVDGTYTHDDGTTSQCSIEVELMAAPEPGADGQWTWQAIELTRWEGCPDAAQTTVALSPTTIFIDSFSADEPTCPAGWAEYACDDGSSLCWGRRPLEVATPPSSAAFVVSVRVVPSHDCGLVD